MVMELNAKELSKLPPEERIKKLREIEKQRQKELKEAEKLIRQSIDEINETDAREEREEERRDANSAASALSLDQVVEDARPEPADETKMRQYVSAITSYNELRQMRDSGMINQDPERAEDLYRQIVQTAKYQSSNETLTRIAQGSSRLLDQALGEERSKVKYFP
jgi:hypothetical protein